MSLDLIRQEMERTGFTPPEIIPDGKLRRFKNDGQTNPDCWMVAFQWNTRSGEVGYNAVWQDWHSDEQFKLCTVNNLKGDDKSYVEKTISEAKRKAEKDQEAEYAKCREESEAYLATLQSGHTDYLTKKGITNLCGSLCDNGNLIIPVHNSKREIQGYQIIEASGRKRFKLHTRKKGNYFTIPGKPKKWLVEGFATGCTVHEATGDTVLVCFDAGNVPEVRKLHPGAILAGDNDDAGHNAGIGLFPPTDGMDWNDFALENGIEAVRKLLTEEPQQWVRPLGYRDDMYYYTSSSNRQIVSVAASSHTSNTFYTLQPKSYWEANFPAKGGADWALIASTLMNSCREQGIFNPKNIRGTGVWIDEKPVINLGSSVWPHMPQSKYTYIISSPVSRPTEAADPDLLMEILGRINFKNPNQAKLLAGWLIAAPFSGALPWRPHIWLTGSAGTGKSTIMEYIISPVLGDYKLYTKGNTTEAGLRQQLGHNALPIIFDEFEQMGGEETRNQAVLDLCRQASSESSAEIMKGSSSGKSTQYNPRFCALVSSIRINLSNDADHSRFTVIDLDEPNREGFSETIKLMDKLTPEYAQGLFTHTYQNFDKFLALAEYHRKDLALKHSARFAQQHSILLAGYELISGEVIKLDIEKTENDHQACLDYLTSCLIDVELGLTKKRTIQESVSFIAEKPYDADTPYYQSALSRHGIHVTAKSVYIANNLAPLKKLFHGTRWANGWVKSLSRIEGAEYPAFMKLSSKTTRCVKLNITDIVEAENAGT